MPEEPKEPFVSQGDRPTVGIDPQTPVSQLTVRDLTTILGSGTQLKPIITEKGYHKWEKWEIYEKWHHKWEKWEKNEKVELEPIPKGPDIPGPDPVIFQQL